ncbi:MAG: 3-hydroxyacyl-CoA dehydrogenase NAD-binding domain-containing protein [Syntrophales bacterium]|nr:3-hydroxyacyl-CoA dehydrogenase NAD-binding domain-containing protein [Syntrophales bacterium]
MNEMQIQAIGILGTGTIGSSWATFFAAQGMKVRMHDVDPVIVERGIGKAYENLEALVRYGLLEKERLAAIRGNIASAEDMEAFLDGVDYVQESVAETYEVKGKVYAEMDRIASPRTILASSSSGLLMSEIQKHVARPERCLIAHPFNPPHLVPLVELVPGQETDPAIVERVKRFFEELGKIPVVLKLEVPGHIANRLAAALWREAIDLVIRGVASVEDVDKALYAGPGIRWALMGQHMIYHLGGGDGGYGYFIDHIGKAFGAYWREMASWSEISPESRERLVDGVQESMGERNAAEISRWRDEKIVGLLKVIYGKQEPNPGNGKPGVDPA